jgi:MFS transporter, ACS family, hexuronate transporter
MGASDPSGEKRLHRLRTGLIVLLFFGTLINYIDRQVLSLLKPTIEAAYGWGDAEFAHFASMSQLAAATALIFVGWLVDRFGVKVAYGAAVAIWSLAGMAHAFATNVTQFVAARVALVAAESINTPAAVKSAAQYLPITQRSMALGIINTAPNIGNIIAPLVVIPMAALWGWQAAFIVTGALGFVWLAAWIIGVRKLPPVETRAGTERSSVDWGALARDRRTWAIAGAKALTDMFWWFFTFWLPDLFNKVFKLSQAELVWPTALTFALAAVGALSGGFLFPRLLKGGRSVNSARKLAMLIFALIIVPIPLALTASSPWVAAVIIGMGLFAHQGFSTNIFGMAADAIPPARVASVMAVGAIAGNIAGFAIQETTGALLTSGIGYGPLFFGAAVAYLLALGWIHLMVPVIRPAEEG